MSQSERGNVLRAAIDPASVKVTIELEGEHAAVQSHTDVPSLYVKPDLPDQAEPGKDKKPAGNKIRLDEPTPGGPQSPEQPEPASPTQERFRIVRTQTKKGQRVLGDVKRAGSGKVSEDQKFVKATTTRVSGGWLKITPTESLAPGEYALVEITGDATMNLFVWDFGVNPKAAPNKNPWVPETKPDAKPANQ